MSKIDLHNYEAFYLDYIEGNLNAEDTAELLLFVEQHPAIKSELEDFELVALPAQNSEETSFSNLKQHITALNAEEYIINSIEGQLNKEDDQELKALIASDSSIAQLSARYRKTILPKTVIEFPNKVSLKRKSGILIFMSPMRRVAAVAIILLALIPFFNETNKPQVAENKPAESVVNKDSILTKETTQDTHPAGSKLAVESDDTSPVKTLLANNSTVKIEAQKEYVAERNIIITIEKKSIDVLELSGHEKGFSELHIPPKTINKSIPITTPSQAPVLAQSNEPLTVGEWLNQNIRKRIFKEEQPTEEKIQGTELLAGAANVLQEKTNSPIAFTQTTINNRSSYTVTIGKFSFSKSKSN